MKTCSNKLAQPTGVVAPHESIHALNGIRRVREPVSRSKSGIQGKVADVLHGRLRHAEYQNEIKAFWVWMETTHADTSQDQPFCLEYHHEGSKHRYTPDILVVWAHIKKSWR